MKKWNIHAMILRLAAVLLILVLLSSELVAGRYARYVTQSTGGGSADVAKYRISVSADSDTNIRLTPDAPASFTFSVTSDSQVAVEYDLVIVLPEALPAGVVVSVIRDGTALGLSSEGNQYKVEKAGVFEPSGGTHTYTLTFTATQLIGADVLQGITVRVDARQVD